MELNKSSIAPNDDVLPQNDDVLPQNDDVSIILSTLSTDQSSGTVEIDVDTLKSEQIYGEDIEVKRSSDANEDVLSQIDDLMIAFRTSLTLSDDRISGSGNGTSFEKSGTIKTGVDELTSSQIEDSAMEDIGVKSSSSSNDSVICQSDDPQVDTNFEQSGTVETSVKLISRHIEESATEDIEVKSSGSANDIILSQSDDLQVDPSFEQPVTAETGVDNSTNGQIEEGSAIDDTQVKKLDAVNDSVSFELLGTLATDVDKLTIGPSDGSAVEDIEVKRSGSVSDCVLSESDDLQVNSSFQLLGMVPIDVDKSASGQIEENAVQDIEIKRSGSDTDNIVCQIDDLQAGTSFEQLGTTETGFDLSTSRQIEKSDMGYIGVKSSSSTNNSFLHKSGDLQVDTSCLQSGTVETGVDNSTNGQTEAISMSMEDIEVKRLDAVNDSVLSQCDDVQIDTIVELLEMVATSVDKSTSGQIDESAVEDIGMKSSSSANVSFLPESGDLQVDTSCVQSGTVETGVDNSTTGEIKASAVEDIELKKCSAANDSVLSQCDDVQFDTSFELLETVVTDVDKSTSVQIDESAVADTEVKSSGSANDSLLPGSGDRQVDTSCVLSGIVETGVDNSTNAQIEAKAMEDIEVKKHDAANDIVLSQCDDEQIDASCELLETVATVVEKSTNGQIDEVISQSDNLLITVSSSSTLDDQSSEHGNGTVIEQSGTVEMDVDNTGTDVDKSTSGQIDESAVEDMEAKSSSSANDNFLPESGDLQVDTSCVQSGTVETGVDNSTNAQTEASAMEDIEVKKRDAANDSVLSQCDDVQVDTSFELLETVVGDVDKPTSGQIDESAVEDIEVKSSSSAHFLPESGDLQVDTSCVQSGTVETGVGHSINAHIEASAVEDIEVKKRSATNDSVLSKCDDVHIDTSFDLLETVATGVDKSTNGQIDEVISQSDNPLITVSSSSTLDNQSSGHGNGVVIEQSGTVDMDVDNAGTEQIEESPLKDVQLNIPGAANDSVLSQCDDVQIDTSFELLETIATDVDKSTSGQIDESAVEDMEAKSFSSANDSFLPESGDLQVDTSCVQSGTTETGVDNFTNGQIEACAIEDTEMTKRGAANNSVLNQCDDVQVDTSFVLLETVATDFDKSTSVQIEESAVEDIEVKSSSSANDSFLPESSDVQVDTSCVQSGTIETGADNPTNGQIEASAVEDIEVKKRVAANDNVLSQCDDVQIDTSFELLETVASDVDKSGSGQIDESVVEDFEVISSSSANNSFLPQSGDLQVDTSFVQSGKIETGVDNSTNGQTENGQIEASAVQDIEVKKCSATNDSVLSQCDDVQIDTSFELLETVVTAVDKSTNGQIDEVISQSDNLLITVSSSSTLDHRSSGHGNGAVNELSGSGKMDVDNAGTEQIEKRNCLLSQSDDLSVAALSSSTLADDCSSGFYNETHFEQVGTAETYAGHTTSDHVEEMPKLVKTSEPGKSGKNAKFNLRKSLAWDSAFFTSDGVLDADELSTMIDGGEKGVKHQLPGIEEEVYRSMDSISTLESDNLSLECLEAELFEDIRASIQKSNRASNTIHSSIKVSPGNSDSHAKVSSSSKKVDLDSGKRPVARFKSNGSTIPQPKIIARVNSASTLTKRASLNTNVAKKDQDTLKQTHAVTQKGTLAAKTAQGSKVASAIGPRRGVPKPLLNSKTSSFGSKTDPTRPSSSCSNSSSCSSGTDVKPSANLLRKKVESRTGKPSSGPVPQTSSRISTKNKAPTPAPSRLPSRMSSKSSSNISPASSVSEWSSESTSSTSAINQRSTPRGCIDPAVSYRSSVESASSIHSIDEKSNLNGNHVEVVPPSQTELSRPTGLRMPSPKIGFFDGGKSGARTPTGGIRSQSGLPTCPTSSNGVKSVKLSQSKTAAAGHTNMKPNPQKPAPKTSQSHPIPKPKTTNTVDKSLTDSSRTPFGVKNSVYDI